jgi:two-component system response regulator YesN
VKNVAKELIENINKCLKLQVWASVGSMVPSVQDLHVSYLEALNLLSESDKSMDQRVITADRAVDKIRTKARRPIECFMAIADAAMLGRQELVGDKIHELLLGARSIPDVGIGTLRDWAIDFVGVLAVAMYDQGLRVEEAKADFNVYKELESIYSADDLAAWVSGVALPVCRFMENRGSQKHKKTIDFIIRFLHEHYAEDITLDMIAEKVYLTRNYLSQIFKQATGENYNNYLTRIRMEKAKELMMTGNYKLYEISEMVGYKNNAYFSQLFKKYTGHNPSEFNQ